MLKQKSHVGTLLLLLILLFSVSCSACGLPEKRGDSPAEVQNGLGENIKAETDQEQGNDTQGKVENEKDENAVEKQKEEDPAIDSRTEEGQAMGYHKITGDEAAEMMKEDVVILDVRTEEEYQEGHISNAVLLPYDTIREENAAEILPDPSKKILVYCRTGRRSEVAAMTLVQLGYQEVYDFGGIMTDWNGEVVK